jgi:protein-disulfide isomerase/uncharacterized membrane protein
MEQNSPQDVTHSSSEQKMSEKNLTLDGLTLWHSLYLLLVIGMFATSLYLTKHYYDTLYPANLASGEGLCNLNRFFNCDTATYSPLAAPFDVPISFLGLMLSGLLLFGSIFPSRAMEQTQSVFVKLNLIGCIALFFYSLIVLKTLCPFCTLYYVLSGGVFYLLNFKGQGGWKIDSKIAAIWVVLIGASSAGIRAYTVEQKNKQVSLSGQIVEQYIKLADYGDPESESPFKNHLPVATFQEAKIRVSVFSDFQCPYCQKVALQMHELIRLYDKNIAVQYFFYPLDSACNTSVQRAMHPYACKAAQLAACSTEKFNNIHDEIFKQQETLDDLVLEKMAKKYGVDNCYTSGETKNLVQSLINQSTKYNIRSTPVLIVNGKKIEGSIPTPQFRAIFDHLLKP